MRVLRPSPILAPLVREHMIVEVGEEVVRTRLPELGFVLGVRYRGFAIHGLPGDERRLPDATLNAMTNVGRRMRTAAGSGVLLTRFHPGGAAAFFSHPLHELFGRVIGLDELIALRDVERLRTQIAEARDDLTRVAVLERFLLGLLRQEGRDTVVARAVAELVGGRGSVPIHALVRRLAISQDRLEKRFRHIVGTSPKQFASLVRFQHAVAAYRPGVNLAKLAVESGYFDQSHLARAVQTVTGMSPGRFFHSYDEI